MATQRLIQTQNISFTKEGTSQRDAHSPAATKMLRRARLIFFGESIFQALSGKMRQMNDANPKPERTSEARASAESASMKARRSWILTNREQDAESPGVGGRMRKQMVHTRRVDNRSHTIPAPQQSTEPAQRQY